MAKLFAGTSGFAYPQWKPAFYPQELRPQKFLEYYARRLNSVEINYTFRQLPAASTLEKWIAATPEGFCFSVKAHQRLTHWLRLKHAEEFTRVFFRSLEPLLGAKKLGPVLFQLPPQLRCDVPLLADYLSLVPRAVRIAVEFRDASWLKEEVYQHLEEHNACLCLAESEKLTIPRVATADFVYFRLRKPQYTQTECGQIAEAAARFLRMGKDAYVFFKHEETPEGALQAEQLLRQLSRGR